MTNAKIKDKSRMPTRFRHKYYRKTSLPYRQGGSPSPREHFCVTGRTFMLRQKSVFTPSKERLYIAERIFPRRRENISALSKERFYAIERTFLCRRENISASSKEHFYAIERTFSRRRKDVSAPPEGRFCVTTRGPKSRLYKSIKRPAFLRQFLPITRRNRHNRRRKPPLKKVCTARKQTSKRACRNCKPNLETNKPRLETYKPNLGMHIPKHGIKSASRGHQQALSTQ